ncbi:histidine phosphatase family protein [Deinococcus sp.]|uniref:histidine phosphatase family protein n=1 Tax=Deinococcus sp. TaxID=47478 RepID=UPI003B5C2F88
MAELDVGGPILYLLRHGQTEWNVAGRSQGRLDSPLTELGRAVATAELVLAGRDVPLTLLDDLAELDSGAVSGFTLDERQSRFPEVAEQRDRDIFNTPFPGGESYASALPRVQRVAELLRSQSAGPVLIVSHEMLGRLLRLALLDLSPAEAMSLGHPQDAIYRLEERQLTVSCSGGTFVPLP